MIVQTTKDINIEKLISECEIKSKKKGIEGKSYSVEVNRQLLSDVKDALKYYFDKYGDGSNEINDGK